MKKILLFLGILFCLISLFPFIKYLLDYSELSTYGKGFIWGKALILTIGISLVILSLKIKKNRNAK
ncbi:MAG: hypothetical protein ACJAZ3_000508 [Sphingobacteriales bacterium]|jgi:hypothetical protein